MTYALTVPGLSLAGFIRRWNRESPWKALWAMMIGFFVIMVDATIVAVANPTIMTDLRMLQRGDLGDQLLPAGLCGGVAGSRSPR